MSRIEADPQLLRDLKNKCETEDDLHAAWKTLYSTSLVAIIRVNLGGWPYDGGKVIKIQNEARKELLRRKIEELDNVQS